MLAVHFSKLGTMRRAAGQHILQASQSCGLRKVTERHSKTSTPIDITPILTSQKTVYYPEDNDSLFLRNADNYVQNYTASHHVRLLYSLSSS